MWPRFETLESKRLLTVDVSVTHDPVAEVAPGEQVTQIIRVFAGVTTDVRVHSDLSASLDNATWERVAGYGKSVDFYPAFGLRRPSSSSLENDQFRSDKVKRVDRLVELGDINNDGFTDLLAFARAERFSLPSDFFLVSGDAYAKIETSVEIDELVDQGSAVRWNHAPSIPGRQSYVVRAYPIGDFNNDGFDDVVILSSTTPQLLYGGDGFRDRTISLDGFNTISAPVFDAESDFAGLPFKVAGGADVNGDGYGDIVFSFAGTSCFGCTAVQREITDTTGGVVVVFGGQDESGELFQPNSGENWGLKIAFPSTQSSIATVADYNQDGFADVTLEVNSANYFFNGQSERRDLNLGHAAFPYSGFNGTNGFNFSRRGVGAQKVPADLTTPVTAGTKVIDEIIRLDAFSSAIYIVKGTKRLEAEPITTVALPLSNPDSFLDDNIVTDKEVVSLQVVAESTKLEANETRFDIRVSNGGPFNAQAVSLRESISIRLTDASWTREIRLFPPEIELRNLPPGLGATLASPEIVRFDEVYQNRYQQKNRYLIQPVFRSMGTVVGSDGDRNGDGIDDIFISSKEGNLDSGYARLGFIGSTEFGANGDFPRRVRRTDASEQVTLDAVIGDVNGDGVEDQLRISDGTVLVFYGHAENIEPTPEQLDGTNGFVIASPGTSINLAVGDLNADGFDDVMISDREYVYVVFGKARFPARFDLGGIDGRNGFRAKSSASTRNGFAFSEVSPMSVASNLDVNHDGIDDLLVGDPNAGALSSYEPTATHHGEAYVLFGRTASTGFGTSSIDETIDIPVGAELTYSLTGTLTADEATGKVELTLGPDQVDLLMSGLSYELNPEPSDLNQNGATDFGDFLVLSSNFGSSDATKQDGDLDGDGTVSFADFLLLSAEFN